MYLLKWLQAVLKPSETHCLVTPVSEYLFYNNKDLYKMLYFYNNKEELPCIYKSEVVNNCN